MVIGHKKLEQCSYQNVKKSDNISIRFHTVLASVIQIVIQTDRQSHRHTDRQDW